MNFLEHAVAKPTESVEDVVKLWTLRIIFKQKTLNQLLSKTGFRNDEVAALFDLDESTNDEEAFNRKMYTALLREYHDTYEEKPIDTLGDPVLAYNVKQLSALFEFNEIEQHVLSFAIILKNESILDAACTLVGELSASKMNKVLANILDCHEHDIRDALSNNARLIKTGLINVRAGTISLDRKLNLLSDSFAEMMMTVKSDAKSLFKDAFRDTSAATLTLNNYPHFKTELDLIIPFLETSLREGRKGVNIFIHGKPGTGKTELVKVLAEHLNRELFEVTSEGRDGDAIRASTRLNAYASAQSFLSPENNMLLFDEVEQVLSQNPLRAGRMGDESAASLRKCWLNNLLENSMVPTIWVSNYSEGIDPAFIRRFDFFFELGLPSTAEKIDILNKTNHGLLDELTIKAIAESSEISPAQLDKSMSILHAVIAGNPSLPVVKSAELIFNQQLAASALPAISMTGNKKNHFNIDYVNTQIDVEEVIDGLQSSCAARLCFYGAPGTGKTALGHYIAKRLEKPILLKKMSDLGSKFVGEMEKNIASAFKEATSTGAILQFDEVDSFLQDRREASQSWQVSQVNEMLTQMESFEGIFIASTNLMDCLDVAVLRRFDLKLEFKPLTVTQQKSMLEDSCKQFDIKYSEAAANKLPSNILTPGDFNVVNRRHRFTPMVDVNAVVDVLCEEAGFKKGKTQPIGFLY